MVVGFLLLALIGLATIGKFVKRRAGGANDRSPEVTMSTGQHTPTSAGPGLRSQPVATSQDGQDASTCENTPANGKKKLYMDMSGRMKKTKKGSATFVQSRDTGADKEDIDVDGYMLSNVDRYKNTRQNPQPSDILETYGIGSGAQLGDATSTPLSFQSGAVDYPGRFGDIQLPDYQEIDFNFHRSVRNPECQYQPEYWNLDRNEKCSPVALDLNDPSYSASIYSNEQSEKHEVDEHGYLVLEASTGDITHDQFVDRSKMPPKKASLYESEIVPGAYVQNRNSLVNSTLYESIPGIREV
ncbi:uncharacterized protein [Diadema antillarum]|uniref:uncharacterized protein n=1 Tax=Diadema antillarum TaxID=105358 RepID=UPI003A842244